MPPAPVVYGRSNTSLRRGGGGGDHQLRSVRRQTATAEPPHGGAWDRGPLGTGWGTCIARPRYETQMRVHDRYCSVQSRGAKQKSKKKGSSVTCHRRLLLQ